MEVTIAKTEFKAATQSLSQHQKGICALKKEVNALKRQILADQKKALNAIKAHKKEALDDPKEMTLKAIKEDARQATLAVKAGTAHKIRELTQRLTAALPGASN